MIENINKFQVKCPSSVKITGSLRNDTTERTWPGSVNMRNIPYEKGDLLGGLIFIKEIERRKYKTASQRRQAVFQCECGKIFIALIENEKRNRTKSCGCLIKKSQLINCQTHGLSKHPIYRVWNSMNQRCINPNDHAWNNYGGRGITVCDEWKNDFPVYFDYVMSLPNAKKEGLTIDRIENNGNYEPGNLRWANEHTQVVNQRKSSRNKSGYVGVCWAKSHKKWNANIRINYKLINLGYFDLIEDAVDARDNYIIDNHLKEYKLSKDYA